MSLLASHLTRWAAVHNGLQSSAQHGQPEMSLGKLQVAKNLVVPFLLRSYSASPQGPKEFDAFPKGRNVLASSDFKC